MILERRHGVRVLRIDSDLPLRESDSVADAASAARAKLVVIAVELLEDEFFDLSTGVAHALVQRFVSRGIRVAIVGDARARRPAGGAMTAWIAASNRGEELAFVESVEALDHRLGAEQRRRTGEVKPYPGRRV